MSGILLDDTYHTTELWNLIMTDFDIGSPSPKVKQVDIPGADGVLDFTEALTGFVPLSNRPLKFVFKFIDKDVDTYHTRVLDIMNTCHGKVMKIIQDSDPNFFYRGRVTIVPSKEDQVHSTITFSVDAEPYKYTGFSSVEDWLWDPFDFETDWALNYKNMIVAGSLTFQLVGSKVPINPTITSSTNMTLTYLGVTYQITQGTRKYYDITVIEGENDATFKGNGTVSVDIRGGMI